MSAPTLINLPPPPSDPVTPQDVPGTPNSTTTSMSELSTVAIKDGHRGHPHHNSHRQQNTPSDNRDAEHADRIRLAGLERASTVRQSSNPHLAPGSSANQPQDYFDSPTAPGNTNSTKERSTVGSASATGSIGGRTTWASGSDVGESGDKMSEDQDMDASSMGGFSDEGNASLVGFGEGSSTVSGPVSSMPASRTPQRQSTQLGSRPGAVSAASRDDSGTAMTGVTPTAPRRDARMIDGMTYDSGVVDTSHGNSESGSGTAAAERIMGQFDEDEGGMHRPAGVGRNTELGKFSFEDSK